MPGRYGLGGGFRATHVHIKITPLDRNNNPIGPTLTTQQYFANGQNHLNSKMTQD